ncbi:MAG TPA: ATPase, T2SS/T4P/T4SS family [Bdellovibrionota bacterium]|jgi:pilus assembly protein CpaF
MTEDQCVHGSLQKYLSDPNVNEVLVNGPGRIWVERNGRLQLTEEKFSEDSLRRYVRRLLSSQGRKVDQLTPFANAVVDGGVRVHVAIPPVSRQGTCLSLRKASESPWTLSRLESTGSVKATVAAQLRAFVSEGKNIFVCGGTGSGKTSLLGALLSEVPAQERILALEDVAEIRAEHPHFLALEARPSNQEGEGCLPLSLLLREALRMRPDRLVVGECRGPEAADLLMALHTGHRGSMATIHANSARDALHRLETLALLASQNLRESALKYLVAACIQVVIHLERGTQGRRIASIAEVKGVEGANYLLRETKFS